MVVDIVLGINKYGLLKEVSMNFLDKLKFTELERNKIPNDPDIQIDYEREHFYPSGSYETQIKGELRFSISIPFVTDESSLSEACKVAERRILNEIYGDLRINLYSLEQAVYARDREKILDAISNIRKYID